MSNLLEPIVQAVVSLVGALGAPGVGIAVAAENLFPPIPSEVILPSAGFAAASGSMGLVSAIVWATIGSVVGALALYTLGAWFGRARFYSLASKIPFVKEADIERAEAWFVRRGPLAVLLGRVVPVVRSLISIPAGIERMKLLPLPCTRQLAPPCGIPFSLVPDMRWARTGRSSKNGFRDTNLSFLVWPALLWSCGWSGSGQSAEPVKVQ